MEKKQDEGKVIETYDCPCLIHKICPILSKYSLFTIYNLVKMFVLFCYNNGDLTQGHIHARHTLLSLS